MYTNDIKELIALKGSFAMPVGAPEIMGDGYSYKNGELDVKMDITRHATGVFSRKDTVKNVSGAPIDVTCARSRFSFDGGEWEVYTQYNEWCNESIGHWSPLVTEVAASNYDVRTCSGAAPLAAIFNKQSGRGYVFHLLPSSMWHIRVFREFRHSETRRTIVELGISERGFVKNLDTGATLELPEILYYEFKSKIDLDAYILHRYVNERFPARRMPIVFNSWMSHEDRFTYEQMTDNLDIAARLGIEYFVIDAGWFGPSSQWWNTVGDWEESPKSGFGGKLKEFTDAVRAKGLKVGFWFEIERAGKFSHTLIEHPEHYLREGDYGFPNFASEAARDYLFDKLARVVDTYGIEYIKFDFNACLTHDKDHVSFLDYFNGRQRFFDRIRATYPDIYLELCSSGGGEMCLASLKRHFESFWMSDDHSLYSQMRFYKDTMKRMPARALETWLTIRSAEDFRELPGNEKILASGDMNWIHVEAISRAWLEGVSFGGPYCISCDLTKLSRATLDQLKALFDKHKRERAHTATVECRILSDTETLTALQWNDKSFDRIRLTAFTAVHSQSAFTLYPVTDPERIYVGKDGAEISGAELSSRGVTVNIRGRYESYTFEFEAK